MTNVEFEVLREMCSARATHPEAYAGEDFYEFYKNFINETSRRSSNGTKEK